MWLIRIFGALVMLVLVLVAILLLLPGDRIAALAVDRIKAGTGRDLTVSGDVRLTLWPVLGVETGPVVLANADWAGPEPMLRAEALAIGVSAPELLRGEVRITRIAATAPVLRLERAADGRGNWEFTGPAAPSAPAAGTGKDGAALPFRLEALRLSDARLIYAPAGGEEVHLDLAALDLRWPDASAPVEIDATLRPSGEPVEIAARIDGMSDFLAGGVVPVALRALLPGGEARFDGRADIAGNLAGQVALGAEDTAAMLAALGLKGAALPRGLGRAMQVETQATYTADGRLALRDLALALDGNSLTGAADLVPGDPPRLTARLNAGALDLSPALQEGGAGGGAPDAEGWSKDAIDASALGLVDASLRLTAESLDTGTVRLGAIRATLELERSRAVLRFEPVSVFGGTLAGQLVANNRGGLSVGGKLHAETIEMREALGALAGVERLSGAAGGDLEFLGVGNSVDAIMRSLSGKGSVGMGRGVIAGFDLDRLMRGAAAAGGTTVFDSLDASYTLAAGDLFNDDLVLKLSRFHAEGAGRVGLGARDVDYLFTPVALQDASGERLAVSVRVVGPWAAPRIKPELSDALREKVEEKRDELERKARDKVEEKLQRELGVRVPEGQSVEDAVKDKLEDEARKGLLKLLGAD